VEKKTFSWGRRNGSKKRSRDGSKRKNFPPPGGQSSPCGLTFSSPNRRKGPFFSAGRNPTVRSKKEYGAENVQAGAQKRTEKKNDYDSSWIKGTKKPGCQGGGQREESKEH